VRKLALLFLLAGLVAVQAGGAARAPKYLPAGMRFVDPAHGYVELVAVLRCVTCPNRIEKTTDGGKTWRSTSLRHLPLSFAEQRFRATWRGGSRRRLQLEVVVSATVGWAMNGPSRLFVSRDGGLSWREVRVPCARAYGFSAPLIAAVSAEHAWLLCLGQPGAGQQNKALYETSDARRWTLRRNLSSSGYGQAMAFSPSGFGLLAESRGGLMVTRSGGRSWTFSRITSPEVAEPQSIALFGRSRGLVLVRDDRLGRKIELYRTRDAGRGWQLLHVWR
jgi:photosystem II stability/assembly factor-like uncharacterized protein